VFGETFTQVEPSEEIRQRVLDAIIQAINEMMSHERSRRLYKDVQSIAKKWAVALQGEMIWLNEEQYEKKKSTFKTKPSSSGQPDNRSRRWRLRRGQAGRQRSRLGHGYRWLAGPRDGDPILQAR
jgi:hypothetical protein